MELIRGIHNLKKQHKGCVLSIGNFDGIHLGHQALLANLKQEGLRRQCPVMVMMFEPQPQEFLQPEKAPSRLTQLRDKVHYLAKLGIDYLFCVNFDTQFATMNAEQFVTQLLVEKLAIQFLAIGDDFRFGANRHGEIALLQNLAARHHFTLTRNTSYLSSQGLRISSTLIRQALTQNHLMLAEAMLGRPYSIQGRVRHGNALGRTIGFPTANLALSKSQPAVKGVYAVEVSGVADRQMVGIANLGTRPTIAGQQPQLEVHLLDFQGDLYGKLISVIFRKKLRDEQRFASLEQLKQQIILDEIAARDFFISE